MYIPVLRIRIRSDPAFLGHLDPDPDSLSPKNSLVSIIFLLYKIVQNTVSSKYFLSLILSVKGTYITRIRIRSFWATPIRIQIQMNFKTESADPDAKKIDRIRNTGN